MPVFAQIKKSAALYPVLKGGKWGYIDKIGRLVIEPRFSSAGEFSEGLALVRSNENRQYGHLDTKGVMVIPPIFEYACPFKENLALVSRGSQNGFIDPTGRMITVIQYDNNESFVSSFSEDLVVFRQAKVKYGYLNQKGETAIKPIFYKAEDFHDGLAAVTVEQDGKLLSGYIDQSGNWFIKPEYVEAYNFAEGLAVVVLKGQTMSFDSTTRFVLGKAGYGIINTKGSMLAEYEFTQTNFTYRDGMLAVKVNDKWGYLDKNAKMAIKPQFEQAGDFSEGLAPVVVKDRKYYINKTGKLTFHADYWRLRDFHDGLARVENSDPRGVSLYGYIDRKGKVIWPLTK